MNKDIILIVQSIESLHKTKDELKKFRNFFKFKEKKECKELEALLHEKIQSLMDDKWTISYLFDLQHSLKAYESKLDSFMISNVFISSEENDDNAQNVFHTMYFEDRERNNKIVLDIIGDTITFTIFDNITGNSFSVSSRESVQQSQKKIESVCKKCIVDVLEEYCNYDDGVRV